MTVALRRAARRAACRSPTWPVRRPRRRRSSSTSPATSPPMQRAPPTTPLDPSRLLDTRTGNGLTGTFKSHVARTFQVTGRGGVPASAVAVTGNLTVTGQTAAGYLYLGPDSAQRSEHLDPQLPARRQPGQRGDGGPPGGRHAGQPVGHLCGQSVDRDDAGHLRRHRLLPMNDGPGTRVADPLP